MDSPTIINTDATAQAKQTEMQMQATSGSMRPPQQRCVLGDMSPNVKLAHVDLLKANKPMQSSPLKRSFTADAEDTAGLQYFKRRKLSAEKPLSQVIAEESQSQSQSQEPSQTRSVFGNTRAGGDDGMSEKPLLPTPPPKELSNAVPAIQETQPSPTEPNTPSSPRSTTSEVQGSSADRQSFSSLINYDPSSQASAVLRQSASRAEILGLRLKIAMYRVKTDQVGVPLDRLKIDSPGPKTTSEAVEEAVAQLRQEAQEYLARQQARRQQEHLAVPKAHPGPGLRPTVYEIYEPSMPSSPPMNRSLEKPSAGELDGATPQRATMNRSEEAELTSSVVKGRVAEGLLGLRDAV
ncbi:arginine-glutamic acid dipeptide repeats protein-like [Teratosphaeria destructans]|uniref:Arginine-glutamic acid dipeptide repeats protein-like n=1 Tax=Teratosphaeria destructans TaxID=418781 RepID=A0A9W7SRA9_9PEZI|nr:arginine-glutamic acid dipeptide repeats protein-like [Teratosphaeria destructans]